MIPLHRFQHLSHCCSKSDKQSAAHNAMSNIQFDKVRNAFEQRHVLTIQSVTRIDLQSQSMRLFCSGN